MKKIRTLLVDDEPPAIQLLQKYISYIEDMVVIGTATNAIRASEIMAKTQVDIIFLDIRMPVLDGLSFLKSVPKPPAAIITTAYREYAVDGYDLDIIDYLLKPITFDRFQKAIIRFREKSILTERQQTLPSDSPHIYVKMNRENHKLVLSDIAYIESLKDYVRIHTYSSKLVVKGNIGSFMKLLPTDDFIRIHRSFAISLSAVESFTRSKIIIGTVALPIGISYRKKIEALFR